MGVGHSGRLDDVVNVEYLSTVKTIGTTEVLAAVGGSNLEDRQELVVYNKSSNTIFYGPTGVTTATGTPIVAKGTLNIQLGDALGLYLIAAEAGNDVIVSEFS